MAKTMYPVVAGVIPTTITSAFKASSSAEIVLSSVEYVPEAPNHITIRDDSNSFITVKYTSKVNNKLSGLSVVEGDPNHSFAIGSFAARVYDAYDNNAFIENINEHTSNRSNPHQVTKQDVGLGNVDNTSDLNKPISNPTLNKFNDVIATIGTLSDSILNVKQDFNSHKDNRNNPHHVTKLDIGLGNVDNTSDINKPISLLVQSALDAKVDKVTGKGLSTNDYTTAEKNKLAGIAAGAEVNVQSNWNTTSQTDDSYIQNKPSTLPNPKALKFTGATNASYDGKTEVSINLKNYTPTIDSNGVVNFP